MTSNSSRGFSLRQQKLLPHLYDPVGKYLLNDYAEGKVFDVKDLSVAPVIIDLCKS
jgi:hypothetical protein